jgi:uncharacterized repeat protein (TIGR03803 family)
MRWQAAFDLVMRRVWTIFFALMPLVASAGVVFTSLHSFTGADDGANPYAGLVEGSDGALYGTTSSGGAYNLGTLFKIGLDGGLTRLYSLDGTNGAAPYAPLLRDAEGKFYGTTYAGGMSNWGTIFQFTTNGTLTTLFSFTGTNGPNQGSYPGAGLAAAPDGSLYGTAEYGGLTNVSYYNQNQLGHGYGTVFRFDTNGTVTVPFVFGNTNGADPAGGLVLGKDGCFYGTATWGGLGIRSYFPGYGTIYKLAPDGSFTNIYKFTGADDGGFIYAGLVQGRDGYLYGAAFSGGSATYGTLFKVSTNGSYIPLHTFIRSESGSPYSGLTEGSDGNFYGTTYGAYAGYGSVFSVTPTGGFTNLVLFSHGNGSVPVGRLLQAADGNFYGTTSLGGTNDLGTVFKLSLPLPPVIKALTLTNGSVTITWSAVAGQIYEAQYSDDLTPTDWTSFIKPTKAVSGIMTATDAGAFSFSTRRFYRVVLR